MLDKEYLQKMEERIVRNKNKVSEEFQFTALTLAELLDDKKHVALYMKLAKLHGKSDLFRIAKTIAERDDIERKGAYFMKVLKEKGYFNHGKKNSSSRSK